MPKKGDIVEHQIDRVAFGGQGSARQPQVNLLDFGGVSLSIVAINFPRIHYFRHSLM
jgi:hypothetical protein